MLSLSRQGDDLYLCRTQFYWEIGAEPARQLQVLAIVSVYLQRQHGHWSLRNYLTYSTQRWPTHQVGLLTYRVPPGYRFQRRKARQAASFLAGIFRDFGFAPVPVTYYVAPDCDAIQHLRGFEYVLGSGLGGNPVCGFYDEVNHLVYAGGQGEAYLHELAHVINPYFPQAHPLLLTGFAGLKGGHYGHNLRYHKVRVQAYLASHSVDLTDPLNFTLLDAETNPQYVIGGIFCELALQQGGLPKLKALLGYGTSDADFYRALEHELHLRRSDLPAVIKQQLLAP
ncbi:hypothetical protein GKZ68_09110 [Hymenobacter sp. BRD128]|uniref:hypothetical protein n=1 Tax=Hymenobacter sp. BRD128 TaxID=2675878 RepID=UPI001562ED54|nr:hypothetical protein [Hymenobacter sp. BRD128]QKG56765.1 hypothetical protein GKZ68_09110 [Hymenobacter sp. BRD128]